MFLTKLQVQEKVQAIIADDIDNDLVFIVGHKGLGKTILLKEIYSSIAFNRNLIVSDGKSCPNNAHAIKRSFAEGIITFIQRNNSIKTRMKFCKLYKQLNIGIISAPILSELFRIQAKRKIDISQIAEILYLSSLEDLKNLYFELAGNMPLVIVSSAMDLKTEEIDYLKSLSNDITGALGARITFVIGIRATPDNIQIMDEIIKEKSSNVWLMPLLPYVETDSSAQDPRSVASISVNRSGIISNIQELQSKVLSNDIYVKTFDIARHLSKDLSAPHYLFVLANQDISIESYEYLCSITQKIYNQDLSDFDNKLILPNNGKLLWLDVLSYYLALQSNIDEAIINTQKFFLALINQVLKPDSKIIYEKPLKNAFCRFIHEASSLQKNTLAEGFSRYYSDFASLAQMMFLEQENIYWSYDESTAVVDVLERLVLDFSSENITVLKKIYNSTQMCFVLDTGLKSIHKFSKKLKNRYPLSNNVTESISEFLHLCMQEACKWQDLTIIDEVSQIGASFQENNINIQFPFDEMAKNQTMMQCFIAALKSHNLKIGDMIMPRKTVFLSYAHENSDIADDIDKELQEICYDVRRDIRDVAKWDSLKEFMQTIRKTDYVLLLVSDQYLRKDNCMYEIMQFLKDDTYLERAFPVVISFTNEQTTSRKNKGLSESMFTPEYMAEIVLFWQNRAKALEETISGLSPENSVELNAKFREIKNMAQNASIFLYNFFHTELLQVMDPKQENIIQAVHEAVYAMNERIEKQ